MKSVHAAHESKKGFIVAMLRLYRKKEEELDPAQLQKDMERLELIKNRRYAHTHMCIYIWLSKANVAQLLVCLKLAVSTCTQQKEGGGIVQGAGQSETDYRRGLGPICTGL